MGMAIISRKIRNKFTKSKYIISYGLQVKSKIKTCDNSGIKLISLIGIFKRGSRLNRIPKACPGTMIVGSVLKGKAKFRRSIISAIIVRQKKPWKRWDGDSLFFEDNSCVITNLKGDLKCSNIHGPVCKEAALVWPRIAIAASSIV